MRIIILTVYCIAFYFISICILKKSNPQIDFLPRCKESVRLLWLTVTSAAVSFAVEFIRNFHLSISELLEDFSIVTIIITPFCVIGCINLFALIKKRIKEKSDKSEEMLVWYKPFIAACMILFLIIIFEFTIFNYHHYQTLFSDKQFDMTSFETETHEEFRKLTEEEKEFYEIDLSEYNLEGTIDDNEDSDRDSKLLSELQRSGKNSGADSFIDGYISINDINQLVSTVYIDNEFIKNNNVQRFYVEFSDEEGTNRCTPIFEIVKDFEKTQYLPLASCGKVSNIKIHYIGKSSEFNNIIFNKTIPLEYNLLRIGLLFIFLFGLWFIRHKKLMLVNVNFNSKKQRCVLNILAFAVVLLIWWTGYTSEQNDNNIGYVLDQYNQEIVDALLAGRVDLDLFVNPKLLESERPYDYVDRIEKGLGLDVLREYYWDHVFYNGKIYSYFGIVPVLILFLPFKVITGFYFPTGIAVILFTCLSALFLMLIWRELVKKYMKNMPFIMYALGSAVIALMPMTLEMVRRPKFYEAAVMSGLCFASAGLLCLLKTDINEKFSFKYLTFASICLALSVGCRPTMIVVSLFLPLILIHRSTLWKVKKQLFKDALCIIPAYAIVAAGLMYYNYIRFGSVIEFGTTYQLSVSNIGAFSLINPVSKIDKIIYGIRLHLFAPLNYSFNFPFITSYRNTIYYTGYMYFSGINGLINYPVIWFLAILPFLKGRIKKESKLLWHIILFIPAISLFMIVTATYIGGIITRYQTDYMWMVVLASLICAYFIYEKLNRQNHVLKITCIMFAVSIIVAILNSITGENNTFYCFNTNIYYHIRDLFGLWS